MIMKSFQSLVEALKYNNKTKKLSMIHKCMADMRTIDKFSTKNIVILHIN